MPYTTQADLVARYGEEELIQLTDRAGDGVVDVAVVNRAIADADAEIDSYLAHRLTLPLAPAPAAVLARHAAILVRAALHVDADEHHPTLRDRAASIAWLRDVARGVASIGPAPASASTPAARIAYRTTAPAIDWDRY